MPQYGSIVAPPPIAKENLPPGTINADGDTLMVRLVNNQVFFQKVDPQGNVSDLTQEEIKIIQPHLKVMDKGGQTTEAQVNINQGDLMPFNIDKIHDTSAKSNGRDIPTTVLPLTQ